MFTRATSGNSRLCCRAYSTSGRYAYAWFSTASRSANDTSNPESVKGDTSLYLHVGPSGDFWTGHSIFAAKHLQPDYVKSVKLDETLDVDKLLELLEDNGDEWTRTIYDEEVLPQELLDRLHEAKA